MGFGSVVFLNMFGLISSQTRSLANKPYEEIVGPRNDIVLKAQLEAHDCTVVLAWGGDVPVTDEISRRRVGEIRQIFARAGRVAHHVGGLSYGTHPRHGRMWNKGYRELRVLDWCAIGA